MLFFLYNYTLYSLHNEVLCIYKIFSIQEHGKTIDEVPMSFWIRTHKRWKEKKPRMGTPVEFLITPFLFHGCETRRGIEMNVSKTQKSRLHDQRNLFRNNGEVIKCRFEKLGGVVLAVFLQLRTNFAAPPSNQAMECLKGRCRAH